MSTVMTFPGKLGDALHQWPIAYHWAKQSGKSFECWMDEKTCKPLVPLFSAQPNVSAVKLMGGVEHWNCGGQPFHMNLPTSAFEGHVIYHLGLRGFPVRQLTLECLQSARVPVEVTPDTLASEPSIVVPETQQANRVVLHGQAVYAHTRNTPTFWKFLSGIRSELETMFDEIVFVGTEQDREVGLRTYPEWLQFDDQGDFLKLAGHIAGARAMIAVGSSPVVLAGLLKVPAIRVHDPIGENLPKVIWANLGESQLNETEIGLRRAWPKWRDRWLLSLPVDTEQAVS
jgi:hypothetical protein